MQPMNEGIGLDQDMLISVLQNKLAQSAIREAQLESGVQQLLGEKQALLEKVERLENPPIEIVND